MISVVIPLYNKANHVEATLGSVQAQTYRSFEIVVVDDGSTDGSAEKVESLGIENLRLIRQQNAGVSAARNRGIEAAKGEYVAFLDADDFWKEDYLAHQYELTKKYPYCDVFATNYEFKDANGKVSSTILRRLNVKQIGELTNYFEVASYSHPPLWTSAVMVRRSALLSVGGFPIGIRSGEDLLTWARLACSYRIAYSKLSKATFVKIKLNEDQKTRDVSLLDEVGRELKILYEKYNKPFMPNYIGLWYKMRAHICLAKNHHRKAFEEAIKSLKYSFNYKVIVLMIFCFMPHSIVKKIIK